MTSLLRKLQEETIQIKPQRHLKGDISLKYIITYLMTSYISTSLCFSWNWKSKYPTISAPNSTIAACCWLNPHLISTTMWRSYIYPPLPRHLVVGVVVTTDAEAKELASGALDLEPLDLQGTLQEPVAGLKVPVAAPQEMHTAHGQEVSGGQPLQEGLELIWMTEREGGESRLQNRDEWRDNMKKKIGISGRNILSWLLPKCWVRYCIIVVLSCILFSNKVHR